MRLASGVAPAIITPGSSAVVVRFRSLVLQGKESALKKLKSDKELMDKVRGDH